MAGLLRDRFFRSQLRASASCRSIRTTSPIRPSRRDRGAAPGLEALGQRPSRVEAGRGRARRVVPADCKRPPPCSERARADRPAGSRRPLAVARCQSRRERRGGGGAHHDLVPRAQPRGSRATVRRKARRRARPGYARSPPSAETRSRFGSRSRVRSSSAMRSSAINAAGSVSRRGIAARRGAR
jgi:hypothetical protein